MIKILIADDHVIVRNGMKQLCAVMGDVSVAAEAANGTEVLEALKNNRFDMLMLDLTMPAPSGVELIQRIRAIQPKLPILILSMRNEPQVAKRVLHAGASGYVTKGSAQEILMAAIRKVAAGERYMDPDIVEAMMFETSREMSEGSGEFLSERELLIMKLIAEGRSVGDIADALYISNKTVSTYKSRLMQKMNFKSTAELVLYAAEYGLVEK